MARIKRILSLSYFILDESEFVILKRDIYNSYPILEESTIISWIILMASSLWIWLEESKTISCRARIIFLAYFSSITSFLVKSMYNLEIGISTRGLIWDSINPSKWVNSDMRSYWPSWVKKVVEYSSSKWVTRDRWENFVK